MLLQFGLIIDETILTVSVRVMDPGLHEPIVDEALFNSVQDMLDGNARRYNCKADRVIRAPLTGRLFDGSGNPMTPSFTHKSSKRVYRYYVSAPLIQGPRQSNENLKRISANALEKLVSSHIDRLVPTYDQWPLAMAKRVEVHEQTLHIMLPVEHLPAMRERLETNETVEVDPCNMSLLRLTVPVHLRRRGLKLVIQSSGPQPAQRDEVLISALRKAHSMLKTDSHGMPIADEAPKSPYDRRMVMLAFLAPEIQRAILEGKQSTRLMLERLIHDGVQASWAKQRQMFLS